MLETARCRRLPLADLAHALIEVELLEAFTCALGVSVALPGHRAEAMYDGLHNKIAGLGSGHRIAVRRPAEAGGESHGVLHEK